jgi:hypothetical protein
MAEEMTDRTERAFSRAWRRQLRIELGYRGSNVRKSMTFVWEGSSYSLLKIVVARYLDQRRPLVTVRPRHVQVEQYVDADEAGDVCSAFDIAIHPVDRFGRSIQHGMISLMTAAPRCPCRPPPWEELTTSDPFSSATRVNPPGMTGTIRWRPSRPGCARRFTMSPAAATSRCQLSR